MAVETDLLSLLRAYGGGFDTENVIYVSGVWQDRMPSADRDDEFLWQNTSRKAESPARCELV